MIFWLFDKNLNIVGEIVLACFQVSPFEEGLDVPPFFDLLFLLPAWSSLGSYQTQYYLSNL